MDYREIICEKRRNEDINMKALNSYLSKSINELYRCFSPEKIPQMVKQKCPRSTGMNVVIGHHCFILSCQHGLNKMGGCSILFFADVDWRAYANKMEEILHQMTLCGAFTISFKLTNYLAARCRKHCWGASRAVCTTSVHKISSWSWKLSRFPANLIFS